MDSEDIVKFIRGKSDELECANSELEQLRQRVAELEAEVHKIVCHILGNRLDISAIDYISELKRDAERYRWLRDMDEDPVQSLAAQYTDCNGSAESISKRIDSAIDAAIVTAKGD